MEPLYQWIGLRENLQENPIFTYIYWENLWFPVDFPLNQSIDTWVWVNIGGTMVIVEMDQHLEF